MTDFAPSANAGTPGEPEHVTPTMLSMRRRTMSRTKMRELPPKGIGPAALYLASDESSYIDGAIFIADGGITVKGDFSRLSDKGGAAGCQLH